MTNQILDRLKIALNINTDTELANYLKIKQPTLSQWRSRDSIDIKYILPFIPENIDLNWLLKGENYSNKIIPEKQDIDIIKKLDLIEKRLNRIEKRANWEGMLELSDFDKPGIHKKQLTES